MHGYTPAAHHAIWVDLLEELAISRTLPSGNHKLLVIAPPGFAKSTWFSVIFPTWYSGRWPEHHVLFLTSSDIQAHQFNSVIKATIAENPAHREAYPLEGASPDRERGWSHDGLYLRGTPSSDKDPAYRAVGYGAHVIGSRSNLIIMDDPLTQEASRSLKEAASAKEYHDGTLDSRLIPSNPDTLSDGTSGIEVAIMTRWSETDLASHLLGLEGWEVVIMPAILTERVRVASTGGRGFPPLTVGGGSASTPTEYAQNFGVPPSIGGINTTIGYQNPTQVGFGEDPFSQLLLPLPFSGNEGSVSAVMPPVPGGDLLDSLAAGGIWEEEEVERSLWPDRFPLEFLRAKRKENPALFGCLYQGDPTAFGGDIFRSEWLRDMPKVLNLRDLRIIQFWDTAFSEKQTADYTVCTTLGVDREYNTYILHVYRRRLSVAAIPARMIALAELWNPSMIGIEEAAFRQAVIADIAKTVRTATQRVVRTVRPSADKVARARVASGRMEALKVYVDRKAPWYPDWIRELVGFPNMANDDQVDSLSGAIQLSSEYGLSQGPLETEYSFGSPPKKGHKWSWGPEETIYVTADGKRVVLPEAQSGVPSN